MKTALVLSAGGMFGAWQAGAWKALAPRFRPDLVVGASIGCLNGWAIAGGCSPDALAAYWMDLGAAARLRPRLPRTPLGGWVDGRRLEEVIRQLHSAFRPQMPYALVATELKTLRPRIFKDSEITAEHLLASCAIPFVFDQRRIGGRIYSDGGLLNAVPEWAAFSLGADRLVSLNALPRMPSAFIRMAAQGIFRMYRAPSCPQPRAEAVRITPRRPLGTASDIVFWRRERILDWIARGERDTLAQFAQNEHSIAKCFERE